MNTLKIISFCCLTVVATGLAHAEVVGGVNSVPSCPTITPGTTLDNAMGAFGEVWAGDIKQALPAKTDFATWTVTVTPSGSNCLINLIPVTNLPKGVEGSVPLQTINLQCIPNGSCNIQPLVPPSNS